MSVFSRNDENVQVPVSFFGHVRDNGEQGFYDDINRSIGWPEFAELLTAYSRERYQRKEDAPLFSPTVFNGIRARENATNTALIALDIEPLATNSEQLTFDEAKTFLQEQGLEGIVYTTASNIDGSRFRVVIPIAVPTDPQTHKRIITAVAKAIKPDPHVRWSPDPGKCNCYSLFYVPGTYQQACVDKERKLYQPTRNDFHHNSGAVYDAATWLGVGEELGAFRKDQDIAESQLDYGSEANSFEDLESAIKTIVNNLERLDYIKVGAALRHELGDGGKPLFIEFARGWKNYNAANTAKDWDSFRHRSDCSAGTVCYWAKQADPTWEKPSRLRWRRDQVRREATTWNSLADYLAERGERATGRTPSADWWTLWWDSYPGMDAEAFEAAVKSGSSDDVHHDPFDGTPSSDEHPSDEPSNTAPLDIFGSLTPEAVLEPDMLPATIRDLAFDAADRVGITPATVAMAAIAVCAAALHGETVIQPTEDWDWVEPPILWCMAVGDPGLTHTAALNAACRPLEAIDREWREADAEAIAKYERAHAIYKEQIRLWDKAVAAGKAEGGEPIEPQEPQRRQLISTDYTMESLEEILAVNPRGILLKIDELAGFIGNFDAYRTGKSGKDRPLALKLWDGGRLAVDRVGRHTLVPNWAAGSVGKMQENKLASLAHILTDDGFMQRFLPYRVGITGMGSHRPADREAIDRYDMLVRFLVNLEPSGRPITLSAGAQEYQREVERITFALKTSPMVSPPMRAHASKLNGLFARLLLVMHMIDHHTQHSYMGRETDLMVVSAATAKRTRDLMVRFLIPNSVSIYAQYFDDCDERGGDARWIADYILSRHSDRITERDLYRAKREFEDKKRLLRAIDSLIDASWLTRSSSGWAVNPTVHSAHTERAEQTRRKREGIKAKIAEQTETLSRAYG